MILQMVADTREFGDNVDSSSVENVFRTYTAVEQDSRTADRATC